MTSVAELTAESIPTTAPAKPKRQRKPKTADVRTTSAQRPHATAAQPQPTGAGPWAAFGVAFTLVLSAGLNGYANAQHAPVAWAGWLMGLAVPVLVLTLSKVAGEKHRTGEARVAWLAGGSGVALLFLSVYHCANSISLLTGGGLLLAVPMALAIDVGLVACEVALICEPRD